MLGPNPIGDAEMLTVKLVPEPPDVLATPVVYPEPGLLTLIACTVPKLSAAVTLTRNPDPVPPVVATELVVVYPVPAVSTLLIPVTTPGDPAIVTLFPGVYPEPGD